MRSRLEDLKELRDLVRSLGRGGGWGPLRRAPIQYLDMKVHPPTPPSAPPRTHLSMVEPLLPESPAAPRLVRNVFVTSALVADA